MRTPLSRPSQSGNRPARVRGALGAADFLRTHDRMAALFPVVQRLALLDKDCSSLLPSVFDACRVMHLDDGQLVLAVPTAALAAKLKQQLPKLQDGLLKRGWQVNAIRLKVQVGKISEKARPVKQLSLPAQAALALSELDRSLSDSNSNQALKAALQTLLQRHRIPGGPPEK